MEKKINGRKEKWDKERWKKEEKENKLVHCYSMTNCSQIKEPTSDMFVLVITVHLLSPS